MALPLFGPCRTQGFARTCAGTVLHDPDTGNNEKEVVRRRWESSQFLRRTHARSLLGELPGTVPGDADAPAAILIAPTLPLLAVMDLPHGGRSSALRTAPLGAAGEAMLPPGLRPNMTRTLLGADTPHALQIEATRLGDRRHGDAGEQGEGDCGQPGREGREF